MENVATKIYLDVGAGWVLNQDVLQIPPPTWEYGIDGFGPLDRVASTGIATFLLDNFRTNSAEVDGYYSPAHDDVLAGFDEGIPVKIEVTRGLAAPVVKFIGTIAAIRPASGLFEHPAVEVEVHDWAGFLSKQELGVWPIQFDKRADEALTTALGNFPIQPPGATNFDTGLETFLMVFDSDHPKISMAAFFAKMCRNELGRIYVEGDGTLVFENRDARAQVTDSSFTLDGIMTEFDISYERRDIFNYFEGKITLAGIDADPTTALWSLPLLNRPSIPPGETLIFTCEYSDPDTGQAISAFDVVDPVEGYEFGSVGDDVSDDLHADLAQDNDAGGNAMIIRLTNNADVIGYLNDWVIKGKGIYRYNSMTLLDIDQDSIDIRGERRFPLNLDQIVDPQKVQDFMSFLRGSYSNPYFRMSRIQFLANQTEVLAIGALGIEPSTLFTAIESVTGVSYTFHVDKVRYTQKGPQLWVDIIASSSGYHGTFIWDSSHWDNEEDARWSA